jgi:hypothetical protein
LRGKSIHINSSFFGADRMMTQAMEPRRASAWFRWTSVQRDDICGWLEGTVI